MPGSEQTRTQFRFFNQGKGGFMASSHQYRKIAAECARLAQAAPSQTGRGSFSAAAKHWMNLAQLVEENPMYVEAIVNGGDPGRREIWGAFRRPGSPLHRPLLLREA
jgi:hypothetical protein